MKLLVSGAIKVWPLQHVEPEMTFYARKIILIKAFNLELIGQPPGILRDSCLE